jgi:hypothetical protein
MIARETVIYCEGYHDRAFWAGWLLHLGCKDPGEPPPGKTDRNEVKDPWGKKVVRGEFGYSSPNDKFIRVVPCKGKSRILPIVRVRLRERVTRPLERVVINKDSDSVAGDLDDSSLGAVSQASNAAQHVIDSLLQPLGISADRTVEGDWVLEDGTTLSVTSWSTHEAVGARGLPPQQTLERIVSAALVAAYPERAEPVTCWLESRGHAVVAGPKEHAWSYMAGWYAEHGCEDFYRQIWREPQVAGQLEQRLRNAGVWRIAEMLAA